MGRHQLRLLRFAIRYPGWHTMSNIDTAGNRAMRALARMGLLELNEHRQFRLTTF